MQLNKIIPLGKQTKVTPASCFGQEAMELHEEDLEAACGGCKTNPRSPGFPGFGWGGNNGLGGNGLGGFGGNDPSSMLNGLGGNGLGGSGLGGSDPGGSGFGGM
jgi:hypothetical protein